MKFPERIWMAVSWDNIISTALQMYSKALIAFGAISIALDTKSGENKLSRSYNIRNKT